jgi:hypothetical protein
VQTRIGSRQAEFSSLAALLLSLRGFVIEPPASRPAWPMLNPRHAGQEELIRERSTVVMTQMDHARDLGPVRYLATLLGTDSETAVWWFVLLVACLLDPAAVLLLLAATSARR